MKKIISLLTIAVILMGCSRKIVISGTLTAGKSKFSNFVVVNDTLTKYIEQGHSDFKEFNKILNNKKYVARTDNNGFFSIKVKPTDSLYFSSPNYIPKKYLASTLAMQQDVSINLEPYPCDTVKCHEEPKYFIVLASKKKFRSISNEICPSIIRLYSSYEAVYSIINTGITNAYTNETIKFKINKEGYPYLFDYDNAVLFLVEQCGKYKMFRDSFIPAYKTSDGLWATHHNIYQREIKSKPIQFQKEVAFTIEKDDNDAYIRKHYPSPYYRIQGNKAIAVYGYILTDIIELEKKYIFEKYGFDFGITPSP